MNNDMSTEIARMSTETLYKNYLVLCNTYSQTKEYQEDITEGTQGHLEIHIHDIIDAENEHLRPEEKYIIINRKKQIVIIGGDTYDLKDYRKEKDRRDTLMRELLFEHLTEGNPWSGAVTEEDYDGNS